jgi:hypothetical protein
MEQGAGKRADAGRSDGYSYAGQRQAEEIRWRQALAELVWRQNEAAMARCWISANYIV